jgi:adenylate cyclase
MGETRKLAAIMAVDVVGYSRLMGEDEAGTAKAVREHREAAVPLVAGFGGRVVKTMGDGLLLEFPSVVAAVECAIAIQKLMVERNADAPPEKKILYRIGVNLGDVLIEGDDILGDGVNIAARLESLCEPGGVLISGSAYDHIRGKIDANFVDLGEKELKNIARPVRVHSLAAGKPAPEKRGAPMRRMAVAPLAAGLVALVAVIVVGAWRFFGANLPAPAEASRFSIVVLPFDNLSGDPAQDYIVDAVTDELTTSLARTLPHTFVIARNTAFTYKGKPVDVKAIGKDLGVRYVLEGSVQPGGNQMRVNAQLIDADTGAHLWAEQFDTARADLLQMQDEIVTHLARALTLQLPEAELAGSKRAPVTNPDAQDLALRCATAGQKAGFIGKDADAAFQLCQQALDIDPSNVRALSFLSFKFWMPVLSGLHSADPMADLARGDDLLSKALAIDPDYAPAHLFKSYILRAQSHPEEAIAEAERALDLNPTLVNAYESIADVYLQREQFEKSLQFFDKAIRLSPHDPLLLYWYQGKAISYFALKQYDQAIEWARKSIAISPNKVPWAHGALMAALAFADRQAEAQEALQSYLALPGRGPKTLAAFKAMAAATGMSTQSGENPLIVGMRKAGMPEE